MLKQEVHKIAKIIDMVLTHHDEDSPGAGISKEVISSVSTFLSMQMKHFE